MKLKQKDNKISKNPKIKLPEKSKPLESEQDNAKNFGRFNYLRTW